MAAAACCTSAARTTPFSIGGLGVGGIGVSKLIATGRVYNLTDTSKFTGAYGEMRTGYALGDNGSGKLWLKNGDRRRARAQGQGKRHRPLARRRRRQHLLPIELDLGPIERAPR